MAVDQDLLAPLEGDNPAGEDLSYEVVFDHIEEARKEANDPTSASPAKAWKKVITLTTKVLKKQSKDLQVAGWLTEAWFKTAGLEGMKDGLELSRGLMDAFWEHVYPLPEGGDLLIRAKPLNWIDSVLADQVKGHPFYPEGITQADFDFSRKMGYEKDVDGEDAARQRRDWIDEGRIPPEVVDQTFDGAGPEWFQGLVDQMEPVLAEVQALRDACDAAFGELDPIDRPTLMKLRDSLERVRGTASRFGRGDEEGGDEGGTEGGEPGTGGDVGTGGGIRPSSPGTAANAVVAAARFLRSADGRDPTPYMVVRALRWGQLHEGGKALDPRDLEAPSMEARTRLNGFLVQEQWEELLDSAEELAASPVGRGWLDLQRFVLTAFRALGPEYDLAASAVRRALSGFLADHPDLPTRVLADGSAAANSDTLAWLRAEGIHDTAPVIRQMLARIESSTMDEWSLAQAAVPPPQPAAPAPQPEVPAGEGEEPEQEDGAGVEEEAEAPEGEVAEGEVQDG